MGSNAQSQLMQRRMRPLLGTFVEIAVVEMEQGAQAIDAAFTAMQRIQTLLSFHDADSDLSRLNRHPGSEVPLDAQSLRVLGLARAMTERSCHLFNCTLGGALVAQGVLPDHGGKEALPCGCADDIVIGKGVAALRRPVRITLDGIAKGYAVDRAVQALKAAGARGGWVNAGGDLRSFGEMAMPVQRREVDGSLTLLGAVRDSALATSAVYPQAESRFPGRLLHEGQALKESGAWSVLARTAWRADALTKVAAAAPAAQRATIIQQLGGRLV